MSHYNIPALLRAAIRYSWSYASCRITSYQTSRADKGAENVGASC